MGEPKNKRLESSKSTKDKENADTPTHTLQLIFPETDSLCKDKIPSLGVKAGLVSPRCCFCDSISVLLGLCLVQLLVFIHSLQEQGTELTCLGIASIWHEAHSRHCTNTQ